MPWTNAFQKAVLDFLFQGTAITGLPTAVSGSWYVGLMTVAPNDAGTGFTEVATGSYARVALLRNTSGANFWTAATSAEPCVTSNNGTVTFPTATADWGTVVSWGLWDASTSGNLRLHSPITPNKVVSNGDTASFAAGVLTVVAGDPGDVT